MQQKIIKCFECSKNLFRVMIKSDEKKHKLNFICPFCNNEQRFSTGDFAYFPIRPEETQYPTLIKEVKGGPTEWQFELEKK